jgi:hypothetical protein
MFYTGVVGWLPVFPKSMPWSVGLATTLATLLFHNPPVCCILLRNSGGHMDTKVPSNEHYILAKANLLRHIVMEIVAKTGEYPSTMPFTLPAADRFIIPYFNQYLTQCGWTVTMQSHLPKDEMVYLSYATNGVEL